MGATSCSFIREFLHEWVAAAMCLLLRFNSAELSRAA